MNIMLNENSVSEEYLARVCKCDKDTIRLKMSNWQLSHIKRVWDVGDRKNEKKNIRYLNMSMADIDLLYELIKQGKAKRGIKLRIYTKLGKPKSKNLFYKVRWYLNDKYDKNT